jgi:hypothetical protein
MDDYILTGDSNGKKEDKKDKFNPFGSDWLMGTAGKKSSDKEESTPKKIDRKFQCNVKLEFTGNEFTAESKEEYVQKVKDSIKEEFDIDVDDSEIHNIKQVD